MTIETLQAICKTYPAVTEDIKWEHHLCFCVDGKMFLMLGLDDTPTTASFKADIEEFEALSTQPGFKPAPYMARNKWIWTNDINNMGKKEWERLIGISYQLVASKLTKKRQKELGLI